MFLITPLTDDEANCGRATLLTDGHIGRLIQALEKDDSGSACDRTLIRKLEDLRA
jgi:hypothetical protein